MKIKDLKKLLKITSAVEDIIDVIRINETSEVKADLLLVAEDNLKKEEHQRFNAYRIGKIEVITAILQKKSFEMKELFEQLKEIDVMGGDYYGNSMKDIKEIEDAAKGIWTWMAQDKIDAFIQGALSEEAKEYHTEGMYTENELIDFAVWYSGMEREKVISAYKRYLIEKQ